jgi:hypothetical protein
MYASSKGTACLRQSSVRMLLVAGIAMLLALLTAAVASAATLTAARAATATVTHFTITGPTTTAADASQSFVVTALDSSNATVTTYTGTVHFTSTDAGVSSGTGLPANYTFLSGDNGVHTFAAVKLETVGSKTITVADATTTTIKGTTAAIAVTPGAAKTLSVTIPTTSTAGASVPVKVTALDAGGNTATGYTGKVYFTSTDANADLPDDYSFVAGDKGVHSFVATLVAAGKVSATDTTTSSITGQSGTDTVAAGTVTHFSVSAPASVVAGSTATVTVKALNASNGVVAGYAGTVKITSTDKAATMPSNATLTSGVGTFSVPFETAGTSTVTAKDTVAAISGTFKVAVSGSDASTLSVSIPTASTAGQTVVAKVSAVDPGGNVDPDYTGTVTFTSSDGSADLPDDYTFLASDKGVHSFKVTLSTAGSDTVTATDTVTGSIHGTSAADVVAAGTVTHLAVTGPSSVAANVASTVTVKALNAFNAVVVTGYTGTVHFTSSDKQAVAGADLPSDYTFVPGTDHGSKTFTTAVTLETLGSQSIKVTDAAKASISGTLAIRVTGAAATKLKVTIPAKGVAGQTLTLVTVTAVDPGGNIDTGYTGIVHFTSSDGSAVLPANYTFKAADNGVHNFRAVRLMTAGSDTVTATDTVTGSIHGTSAADVVTAGTVTHLSVTGTAAETADTGYDVTVTALNAYDATVTGYTGKVHFTSSDGNTFKHAVLPADYTFLSGDHGSKTFTAGVTLETAGYQTVTATDAASKAITGTRRFTIGVGAAKTLSVSGPKYVIHGTAFNVTITALDAGGNIATGYVGKINALTLGSVDAGATLPVTYQFLAGDNGSKVESVTLVATGPQTVIATDHTTGSITGTSATITVH